MLSSEAVIDRAMVERVIAAGHSRVPVYEGQNKQAILGLVLVKELGLVDETAGVKINQLRLREMPFLRCDVPLYDVMKIFRFGRKRGCLDAVWVPCPLGDWCCLSWGCMCSWHAVLCCTLPASAATVCLLSG
jgi:hypothetical protein